MNKISICYFEETGKRNGIIHCILPAVGIILLSAILTLDLIHIPNLEVSPNYEDLLENCFNLIIGVELIPNGVYTPTGYCI